MYKNNIILNTSYYSVDNCYIFSVITFYFLYHYFYSGKFNVFEYCRYLPMRYSYMHVPCFSFVLFLLSYLVNYLLIRFIS